MNMDEFDLRKITLSSGENEIALVGGGKVGCRL